MRVLLKNKKTCDRIKIEIVWNFQLVQALTIGIYILLRTVKLD